MELSGTGAARVLIVDDEPEILTEYSAILSPASKNVESIQELAALEQELFGHEPQEPNVPDLDVTLCKQGDEAVDAVKRAMAANRPFAVAFLDVRMPPGIDGVTAAARIREMDPNISIVIVTGYSDVNPRDIAKRAPPIDRLLYFQKPLQSVELVHMAHALVARWSAERELASVTERLRQIQKLKAIGQLSGGVAHDFNNLLGVILGNAELLADSMPNDSPALNAILRATTRGADMTQRLLAFSRQQKLENRLLDANDLLSDMAELLRSSLGETINFEINLADNIWAIDGDPSHLENAILNLVLNARDAMPDGGNLVIETANIVLHGMGAAAELDVDAGEFVSITVIDTGCGITGQNLAHVFDPYFTTKDVGQGDGLGLSMVHGLIRQLGGDIDLKSVEDRGTTITLYLPKAEGHVDKAKAPHVPEIQPVRGETVLVLEDEPELLRIEVSIVESLGFQVLEAKNGGEALTLLREHGEVALLISDIVLPGQLSGPDVAAEAKKINPEIKILLMSGYTDHASIGTGEIGSDALFIGKPFRRAELADKIHEALQTS